MSLTVGALTCTFSIAERRCFAALGPDQLLGSEHRSGAIVDDSGRQAFHHNPAIHFAGTKLVTSILCPICRLVLDRQTRTWTCAQGHSFDVAREGYVNLLPVQHKHSRAPGDKPEMVKARREFLQAGHYERLRKTLVAMLASEQAQTLLDIGCGEGYYTSALTQAAREVTGIDIAKPAIQLAAKRFHGITWLVASGAVLPIADASVDVVTSLFSQLHIGEMHRVLKDGGRALVVTPAGDHLWSLRQALFEEVRAHQPDKFLAGFEGFFDLCSRDEVRVPLHLDQAALRQLVEMTPYAWKAKPERRAALIAQEALVTEAAFTLFLFRKK